MSRFLFLNQNKNKMKSNINRHTTVWKKIAGISLAIMFGLVGLLPNTAEARLIFTTEDDGVNADAYHLDNDDSSADFIDLSFGSGLDHRLRYDIVNNKFLLNENLNLEGNALEDFRVENSASALTCSSATDKGRMYYDTTNNDLLFCDGTQWISTSTNANGLDGEGLVVNAGTGKLDVNVDNTTLEINTDTVQVKDGGISTAKIADDAVTTGKIAAGAVENSDLANDAVNSAKIADGSITKDDLGTNSVEADEIATGAVTTDEILDGTITTADINLAGFSIGSGQITDNSLTADDLGTDSVGADELANNAVDSNAIQTGAVTTNEILDGTIATVDIADGAVDSAKILDGSIGTNDIAAGANNTFLTTDGTGNVVWELKSNFMSSNLASGQMWVGDASGTATAVTMSGDVTMDNTGTTTISNDAITTTKIAAGAVENSDLANDAVNSAKIADGSITKDDLGTNSVEADEIATGAVTTDEILDGTVSVADLNATGAGNNKTLTTDGSGNMVWVDDAAVERNVSAHVSPEFSNFTLQADGTNNKGTLESDHDDTANKNYYKWKTRKTANMQDYDIVFQWMVPDDFQSWATTGNSIEVDYKTKTTSTADNKLDITMTDTAGNNVTLTSNTGLVSTTANTWVEDHAIAGANLSGTFTPGEYVTIKIKMSSKRTSGGNANPAYLGAFNFNYVAK